MNKYQILSELFNKMTQQRVKDRSESCQQIVKDKHLWTLSENELPHFVKRIFLKYSNHKI